MKKFDIDDRHLLTGRNLIEASAGTGKTYSIALLFLRLLLEKELELDKILAVTFTNAAADELKGRIRQFIKDALQFSRGVPIENREIRKIVDRVEEKTARSLLEMALLSFDDAAIFTIHGFCQRVLIENAFESGTTFGTELLESDAPFRREWAADFIRKHFYSLPSDLLNFIWPKMDLPVLEELARGVDSKTRVIPECQESITEKLEELQRVASAFQGHFHQARQIWEGQARDEIQELIQSSSLKGKSSYKDDKYEALDRYFRYPELAFTLSSTQLALLKKFSYAEKLFSADIQHPFFTCIDSMLASYRDLSSFVPELKALFLLKSRVETGQRKERAGVQSFDDLIQRIFRALNGPLAAELKASLQKRYHAVLIDESQDTDPVQFEIFKRVFDDDQTILFFIGDPKQSIYSFRGADIYAYRDVVNSGYVQTGRQYSMDTNYRSTQKLVDAVNKLFSAKGNPFLIPEIELVQVKSGRSPVDLTENGQHSAPLQIWYQSSTEVEAHHLARGRKQLMLKPAAEKIFARHTVSEIVRLLDPRTKAKIDEAPLRARDIAVLVKTNKQGRMIKNMLSERGVQAVMSGDSSVFASFEAIELRMVLLAVSEPGNTGLLKAARMTSILGGNLNDFEVLSEQDWEREQVKIAELSELWQKRGFFPMFHTLLTMYGLKRNLLQQPNGERVLTNITHLAELLKDAIEAHDLGISNTLEYLSERITEEGQTPREFELRLESDSDAVVISTIHKSKGLEYPVVFCPFLWSNTNVRTEGTVKFHVTEGERAVAAIAVGRSSLNDEQLGQASLENRSEALRLMYVAVTRAVSRCYIFWGKISRMESSALAYLLHRDYSTDTKPEKLFADLCRLNCPGLIEVLSMPGLTSDKLSLEWEEQVPLAALSFQGSIPWSWRFTSYSGLIRGATEEVEEQPGIDEIETKEEVNVDPDSNQTIFSFKKGAQTGLAWHDILEKVDFTAEEHQVIAKDELSKRGFTEKWMLDVSLKMIKSVLQCPLMIGDKEFTLSKVTHARRISELEFYFKVNGLTQNKLKSVLGDVAAGLNFKAVSGFMKGFIDLVLEYEGKFYIIDWKSNHLGNQLDDYLFPYASLTEAKAKDPGCKLLQSMIKGHYLLQYHVYTVALHLYLQQRLREYDYDRHFGGVFYLYLRGIDPSRAGKTGVFRDRPHRRTVEQLTAMLTGGQE
ncbi:MAG: exodeoxyribonuclease V subunit beta [Proteobacteria bacterium]|nr:MAG: exodeoxyribonuclease V subunit beta [Pseudomonadota bacterium]